MLWDLTQKSCHMSHVRAFGRSARICTDGDASISSIDFDCMAGVNEEQRRFRARRFKMFIYRPASSAHNRFILTWSAKVSALLIYRNPLRSSCVLVARLHACTLECLLIIYYQDLKMMQLQA
mmetsp:Transcript_61826/g.157184  ORF Transcript_61826/g.157184 Transcript_61826/m.157184 type:complete len:122 (-) Transcript_61826:101-466(-)